MTSRRNFIKKTATGSVALTFGGLVLPSMANANILGANDHINCAIIGVRSRAKAHVMAIHQQKNAKIVYSCDVDDTILEEHNKWCQKNIGYIPKIEKDFRKVLEDKDVDAVFIATPEHWHAPMAIMALQAGKHVYVEKPCSHNPYENDLLVRAHKKYGKKVQMGNQQRSARTSIMGIEDIRNGVIGEVYKGEAYYSSNRGSIGKGNVIDVPDTLDWEMWQGPAPREKYRDNVHPYNWHWFKTWGTGEVHNNGTHEIDICRWALGVDLPESVTSFGGKYAYDDDWQFVDNQQVTYKYPDNKFITWTGHSRGKIMPKQPGRGATIYGSKGIIQLDRNFYKLYDLDGNLLKEEKEGATSATTNTMGQGQLDVNHVGNFFEAIRTDKSLHSDISDASISTMLCHLGNMAQDAGETLKIDQATGKILNNEKAMAHWKREYAEGWEPKL
ncbi:Gfo/Idh/MocA family oxidoreductase [Zobellia galactanivorans]|uniref:NAD(P)-dependent dehydrogenase, exported n=1 Tax=Zobellia galactanivorans (strain DSM 12802 / CCUG 47099 / CIP 106680 / NCIMB 13871 / Dsij) TaxID=63186 RepID=G0L8M8_ZOBGA|nr:MULTISPECIES: Gfo/Idh/MocA family oxidoreductase [Zobellia]MBU3024211.1 Gfo/Idh/MocA family oxidoreductase [Zobellia galactanivorans]MDO6809715.1 Gfo/Idh/MocA family oxidoreductase [Zobellia galactanivorans]OWW23639.1 oxidoreductase [Zobellia sp. OII3]CAZ97692.1 NAD(P)-dependent dehydrogenase, exported [Zobellia galactanivorans]